jgi:hypothetical protein
MQLSNADTRPHVCPHSMSSPVFSKTIAYIAKRCIMNTKKILVKTPLSRNSSPGFGQQATAMRKMIFPRKLRYRTRKDKTQIVPCMPLYRNTMYYEHLCFFCQYPFDIQMSVRILHSSIGII